MNFIRSLLLRNRTILLSPETIFQQVEEALTSEDFKAHKCSKGRKENKIEYYNIPASFDIETSSFYLNGEKCGCMYIWQFGICGFNFIGRTWADLLKFMQAVHDILELNEFNRLCVYIHNASYEFQWIRKHLSWKNVFAIDTRKVAYAVTTDGFEFRCSYILTGKSLEMVGDDLIEIPCEKLHTLDYKLVRLPTTPIEPEELQYCVNDIMVVQSLIFEKIMQDGSVARIPLTKTSYVRRFLKSCCLYGGASSHKKVKDNQFIKYRRLMKVLQLNGYKEYHMPKDAFMGGFTHSNPRLTRKIITEEESFWKKKKLRKYLIKGRPASFDYTSDYPGIMVSYSGFPMSRGEFVRPRTPEEFEHNLKYYCCIFEIELHDVETAFFSDFYIPVSKCRCLKNYVASNGRIVRAETLTMTITEVDYDIIRRAYTFDKSRTRIGGFVRYRKGYLPTPIVEAVLSLYKDKTELKGIESQESYYQLRKELLNSCYGCIVTDILRLMQVYEGEWLEPRLPKSADELIDDNNNKTERVLFYPWGIYVTAVARWNLWQGIFEFDDDYIYSDTDSLKVINVEKHQRFIDNWNRRNHVMLEEAMQHHGLDLELCHPKTKDGEEKWIGDWDFEGYYKVFKTLGCKRYMTYKYNKKKDRDELSITVSGLNKKKAVPYMLKKYKTIERCFEVFDDDLYIPPGHTGKLTHTYIDEGCSGTITDYLGNEGSFEELSFIHLEEQDYSLGINQLFKDFIETLDNPIE